MDGVREFLESSTIHGLAHISTGTTVIVKVLWAIIVVICFCFGISLIAEAFHSWQLSPIITSVDTQPIGKVTFPEITICPPKGSNTALNIDLLALEKVQLTEVERENLVSSTVTDLYSRSIDRFISAQRNFHPTDITKNIYSDKQELYLSYVAPGSEYQGAWYPEIETIAVRMNKAGDISGQYETPRFGEIVTEESLQPGLYIYYTAYIPPKIFDPDLPDTVLVVELEYYTDPSPEAYGDVPYGEGYEKINFEKLNLQSKKYDKSGLVSKFRATFPLEEATGCSFKLDFERYSMQQKIGMPEGGFSVSWHFEDGNENKLLEVNEDVESVTI